jgi:hypothetical protein
VEALLGVLRSSAEPDAVRLKALQLASGAGDSRWMDEAIRLVRTPQEGTAAVDAEAVSTLANAMMLTADGDARREEIMATLDGALEDSREQVRLAALWSTIGMKHGGHAHASALLVKSLQAPAQALFKPEDAINGLVAAGEALEHASLIQPYLKAREPSQRIAAIFALAADRASRATIAGLLADAQQPPKVRSAAIQAMLLGGTDYLPGVLAVAVDRKEDPHLRAEAVAAIGVVVRSPRAQLTSEQVRTIIDQFGGIASADAERIGPVLARTVLSAHQRLKQPSGGRP